MELWTDLLFGNPIGLASVITVGVTFVIIVYLLVAGGELTKSLLGAKSAQAELGNAE